MKAQDFVSESDYLKMSEKIRNQQPLEFEKKLQRFKIRFYSGFTQWHSETVNEGDYYVGCDASKLFGDYHGCGRPLEKAQCEKIFSNYENLIEFVDKSLRNVDCPLSALPSKVEIGALFGSVNSNGQIAFF